MVGQPWNLSSAVKARSAAHGNRTYKGVGWYFTACVDWPSNGSVSTIEKQLIATTSMAGDVNVSVWLGGTALTKGSANTSSSSAVAFAAGQLGECGKGSMLAARLDGSSAAGFAGLDGLWWYAERV